MTTVFPAKIDTPQTLPIVVDGASNINAETINRLRAAILQIEETFGINPQATFGSVRARLDAISAAIAGAGNFIAAGDLAGTAATQRVVGLQGFPISNVAPTNGEALTWNGVAYQPLPIPAGGITTLTTDVNATGSGSVTATVVGLQGKALSSNIASPNSFDVVGWNATTSKYDTLQTVTPVANARHFGAKFDGVHDDGAAIQAAIDSLGTNGGEVVLGPGTALTSIEISIKQQGTVLRGLGTPNGANSTTIQAAPAALAGTATVTNGSRSITFSQSQTLADDTWVTFSGHAGFFYRITGAVSGTSATLNLPYGGSNGTVTTQPLLRSVLRVGKSYCHDQALFINANRLAAYSILRDSDTLCVHDRIFAWNAEFDGWHSQAAPVGTISLVTPAGGNTSPLFAVARYGNAITESSVVNVKVTHTGSLGSAKVQTSIGFNGTGYGSDITLPIDGIIQPPRQFSVSGASYNGFDAPGLVLHFPAGTYTSGDSWTFTLTTPAGGNDAIKFKDIQGSYNGRIYATSGLNYSAHEWDGFTGLWPLTAVSGTVGMTAGSNLITGASTSFFDTGAREGDFIRVGPFTAWQSGHSYTNGDLIYAGYFTGAEPLMQYIWQAQNSGTSGGSAPLFPTNRVPASGFAPGSSPVSQTVNDNGITWKCVSAAFFQILCVLSNTQLIVCGIAGDAFTGPQLTRSGMDFAICRGSGWYCEPDSNSNLVTMEKALFSNNVGLGLQVSQDFGAEFKAIQVQYNAIAGFGVGLDSTVNQNIIIEHPYCESNTVCDIYLGGCEITIVEPTATVGVFNSGNNTGRVIGMLTDISGGVVDAPLGTDALSQVPSTSGSKLAVFGVQGGFARLGEVQVVGTSSTIQVDPGAGHKSVIYVESSGGDFTSTPTIQRGVLGQEITLVNLGYQPWSLVANPYPDTNELSLSGPKATLGFNDVITLRYQPYNVAGYPNVWMQIAPIVRATVPGKGPTMTLANGNNNDVLTWGNERMEVSGPSASFAITGIAAFSASPDPYGSYADGLRLRIVNTVAQSMTIKHNNTSSTAANRILCPGSTDLVVFDPASSYVFVDFVYLASQSRWIVEGYSQ